MIHYLLNVIYFVKLRLKRNKRFISHLLLYNNSLLSSGGVERVGFFWSKTTARPMEKQRKPSCESPCGFPPLTRLARPLSVSNRRSCGGPTPTSERWRASRTPSVACAVRSLRTAPGPQSVLGPTAYTMCAKSVETKLVSLVPCAGAEVCLAAENAMSSTRW